MYRSNHQRLWCFQAALDDLAETMPNVGVLKGRTRSVDYRLSAQRASAAMGEIVTHATSAAPLHQISRLYAASVALDPRDHSEGAGDAGDLTNILHLNPKLTQAELKHIRRAFAMRNHPDRVPADLRERADKNMAMVNALVDGAIRSIRVKPGQSRRSK